MRVLSNSLWMLALVGLVALNACTSASGDNPGVEYAPQMYHSTPYEPLSQITDSKSGDWVGSDDDEYGEFYNSNPYNPHGMTMRKPVQGTVRRSGVGGLPYRLPADSLEYAANNVVNPYPAEDAIIAEGKKVYEHYCLHCHGENGQGNGKVGEVIKGVPAYNKGQTAKLTQGHIFHVITHGKGRMGAHGSQVSVSDRWKVSRYVETMQKQ